LQATTGFGDPATKLRVSERPAQAHLSPRPTTFFRWCRKVESNKVRRIACAGQLYRLDAPDMNFVSYEIAGTGLSGYETATAWPGGVGKAATPYSVAVDSSENLYLRRQRVTRDPEVFHPGSQFTLASTDTITT